MTNITISGLPSKTGTIDDGGYLHINESGVDKKATVAQLKEKISSQYSSDIDSFLGSANKEEGRANLSIDRRVAVDNADYTILATDKVVAQIGTMSAARIFTLPDASTVQAGAEIIVIDESGSVNGTNKITVQRYGADTIDGVASIDLDSSYGTIKLICDGTDSWKIANPPQASSTLKGIVELLTDAELSAGTDTKRVPTAANILSLFASSSQSSSGYVRIPINVGGSFDEIIIQWAPYIKSASQVVFPITFPNAVLQVYNSIKDCSYNSTFAPSHISTKTWTTSGFYSQITTNTIGASYFYLAIGY